MPTTPFDIERVNRQRDAVRAAKLAVLKARAQQTTERTDASARKVEEALAHVAAAMTDEPMSPV
jgi:hypothetical protein